MSSSDDRLINSLLYAIDEFPEIGKTRLMKFVFFVDLISYNETNNTLLETKYKRMDWGPVPDKPFSLTGFSNKFFDVEEVQLTPEKKRFIFPLKVRPNRSVFSEGEIDLFNKIIRLFKKMSAEEISDFTHQLSLWKNIEDQDVIPLEMFKLNESEHFQLMSIFAYDEAVELAREFTPLFKDSEIRIDCG